MSEESERIATITVAARRCGLAAATVRRYVRCGLVKEPLTGTDLATLRRIRRLTALGVNLAGVEIALHMHCLLYTSPSPRDS